MEAALNGKAGIVHTHTIAQVDGLEGRLETYLSTEDARIDGRVITIGGVSLTVPTTVSGGSDDRIPTTTTATNYPRFSGTDGGLEQRTRLVR